jgi:hypothetical protein
MRLFRPLVLAAAGLCFAAPDPATAAPDAKPGRTATPDEKKRLVELFTAYLNADSEQWYKARPPLVETLKQLKDKGYDALGDLDTLMDVIYAARPFKPAFSDKKGRLKEDKVHEDDSNRLLSVVLAPREGASDSIRFGFSLPVAYPDPKDVKKVSASRPFPLVVTLGELVDYQDAKGAKEWPAEETIKRRYGRTTAQKAVGDEWMVLAPVAPRGQFSADDNVRHASVTVPLFQFLARYHMDFDRVVLDGGEESLEMGASHGIFFAGLIVRSSEKCDIDPDLVRNFAHLPVYVVGSEDCVVVRSLRKGGHAPTVGREDGIPAWLKTVKRTIPRKFGWIVKDAGRHAVANWVNVNEVTSGAAERTLAVEVVDTEKDPNTVRVEAKGLSNLTFFLNDRVVDLSRDVRIVVNGQVVVGPQRFERKVDEVFTGEQINLLRSQYYGWLFPVRVQDVKVPEKAPPPAPDGAGPGKVADQAAEDKVRTYFDKAAEFEKSGEIDKAIKWYGKVVEEGETSIKAAAEAKVKELSEKTKNAAAETPK